MGIGLTIALVGLFIVSFLFCQEIVTSKKIMSNLITDHFKSIEAFGEICRKIGTNRGIYDYDINKTNNRFPIIKILKEIHYTHNGMLMMWIRDGYDERGIAIERLEDG